MITPGSLRLRDFERLLAANELAHVELSNFGEAFLNKELPAILAHAHERGVATSVANGSNFNRVSDAALEAVVRFRLREILCSIDGASPETYARYRVGGDFERVIRNIERLNELKARHRSVLPRLTWQLVAFGHNEHEIGRIVEFAIEHPAIRGVTFQPAFHAGRHGAHDPMKRMTIPEIVRLIEAQTAGKFIASDFVPVPCCFPICNSVTYAFVEDGKVTPLPRIVDVNDYLDYITNRIVPDFSREVRTALEGLWSSSSVAGSEASERRVAISCQTCELPDGLAINSIAKNMIMVMLQDFMDPWTFNQKNVMKCCKEFLLPGGKQIPFCAFNTVGYREQARAQLNAMEPERRRARKEGRPFEPKPIVFDFGDKGPR